MAHCLVVGLGYVGLSLAHALVEKGHEVIGVCRRPKETEIKVIYKDLFALVEGDFPKSFDYVFYLISPDDYNEQAYQKAYVKGVQHVLDLIRGQVSFTGQALKRFFLISSTGVYTQSKGEWVDEQTSIIPNNFKSRALYEGEQLALKSQFPATIIRFGGIYGPDRTKIIEQVLSGQASLSDEPLYTNRIHLEDCVGVCLHLLGFEDVGTCYVAVDCLPVPMNDVLMYLAFQLNTEITTTHHIERNHKRCSNRALLQTGYKFIYPTYEEGYFTLVR